MRKLALSGLAAVAAVLGGTIPTAASAATTPTPTPTVSATPVTTSSGYASSFGDRISCVSTTECLTVGADTNSAGNSAPVAMVLHGTTWKSVAVKTPYGATSTELTGVSCKAANYCLVTGDYVNKAGDDLPYVLTWNGSTLSAIVKAPLPSGDTLVQMGSVSCTAVKSCVVFGSAASAASLDGGGVQVIWTWNGSQWGRKTAPSAAGELSEEFDAAQCFSLTSCVEVGQSLSASGTENELFGTWNGTSLTTQTVPEAPGTIAFPSDMSCSSSTDCAVVGFGISSITSANADMTSFLQVWNGSSWKSVKWSGAKNAAMTILLGVSCATANYCVAVGGTGTDSSVAAVSLVWNGTHWSPVGVPGVGRGLSTIFSDASCLSSGHCVAFGEYGPETSTNGKPLAGYLNGTSWRLVHA